MIKKIRSGFTIIEVTLAMTFVAVLLITIAVLTINITSIYQKALAVRSINSAGREIIDDISRFTTASPMVSTNRFCGMVSDAKRSACFADHAYGFIYQQNTSSDFRINGDYPTTPVPVNGAFCTGRYSYIWNTGYVLNDSYTGSENYRATISYTVNGGETKTKNDFHLIRVFDSGSDVCNSNLNRDTYAPASNHPTYTLSLGEEPTELLDASESNIAVYDLRIFPPAVHALSNKSFYSGTFVVATIAGNPDVTANGNYCEPPEGLISDFNYCSINKFNFAVQATGESDV